MEEIDDSAMHSPSDEEANDEDQMVESESSEFTESTSEVAGRMGQRMFLFEIVEENMRCRKCDITLDPTNHNELIKHIATKHDNELEEKYENSLKKTKFARLCDEDPSNIDVAICNFFSKYGLSADVIRDVSFMQLVCSIGESRSLPNPAAIDIFVKKSADKYKKDAHVRQVLEPISVTVDVLKTKTEIFLVYSAHYFNKEFMRKTIVFLRKLTSLEVNVHEILNEMRKALFGSGKKINFTNLVATNSIFEKAFYKTGLVNNSYICYFSYISNFAEALIRHDLFQSGVETLKDFIVNVRSVPGMYGKLHRFIAIQRAVFDLPETDYSKWTGVSDFLSQILHLHPYLVDFTDRHKIEYIDDHTHAKLSYLQLVLGHMQVSVKKCSTPDSSISQVVPEVIELKKFIDGPFSADVKKCFKTNFKAFMHPLINQYRASCYEYATFLDPRYAYEIDVFSDEEWARIRKSLKNVLVKTGHETRSETKLDTLVENELQYYEQQVEGIRVGSCVNLFDWWSTQATEMPILFSKARVVLCPPPCAIDAEHYFGKRGKLNHMNGKMTFKKFNDWLVLAGSQEKFRGRGCPENEPVQLDPISIGVTAAPRKNQPLVPSFKRKPPSQKDREENPPLDLPSALQNNVVTFRSLDASDEIKPQIGNDDFTVKDEPLDDDLFESMLMQPPPEKRARTSPTLEYDESHQFKVEEPNFIVKNEVEDNDYNMPGTSSQSKNIIFESNSNVISFTTKSTNLEPTTMSLQVTAPKKKVPIRPIKPATINYNQNFRNRPIAPNLASLSSNDGTEMRHGKLLTLEPVQCGPIVTAPIPHVKRIKVLHGSMSSIRSPTLKGNALTYERQGSYRGPHPPHQSVIMPTELVNIRTPELRKPYIEIPIMRNPAPVVLNTANRAKRMPPIPLSMRPPADAIRKMHEERK